MYKLFIAAILLFASINAYAKVQGKEIVYQVDGAEFTGYLVCPLPTNRVTASRPVAICKARS